MHLKELREAAKYYKENPEGVKRMGRYSMRIRTEKAEQIARKRIAMGKNTLEGIDASTDLPLKNV